MLRFLLDEHISKKVAIQARKRCPEIDIVSIHEWETGRFLGVDDSEILLSAARHGLTLVTYDQNTMLTHMGRLATAGIDHGGIVLIDDRTIHQSDTGRLVKAICQLFTLEASADWRNRTVYLRLKN